MAYTEPRHPINFVAKQTGLSTHAIRVWERRYGAVNPQRSDTNRRLYSDEEVDRLRMLARLSESGHTISRIANLSMGELEEMVRALGLRRTTSRIVPSAFGKDVQKFLNEARVAVVHLDDVMLAGLLNEGKLVLSRPQLLEQLIAPLMTWIGDQWESGDIRIGHEHMASGVVREFLSNLRSVENRPTDAPVIIISTPAGQAHEIGAQLAASVAASMGWNDVYLGPDLPAQEIASVAINRNARMIALSICTFMANSRLLTELSELRKFVPDTIPIVAGGRGAGKIPDQLKAVGIEYIESFPVFREYLSEIAVQPA